MPRGRRAEHLLEVVAILLIAVALSGTVADTDPFWMVRAGREWLDTGILIGPDRWSWAPEPGDVYPNSPLWNVMLALAWTALGSWGIHLVSVLTISTCLLLVRWLATMAGAGFVARFATIVVLAVTCRSLLTPRPALAAVTLLLLALALALLARRWSAHPSVVLVAAGLAAAGFAISAVGNWVHLSWSTMWVAAAAAWTAVWGLTPGIGRGRWLVLSISGAAGLGCGFLLAPYGLGSIDRAGAVATASQGVIVEWSSPFAPDLGAQWWGTLLVVGALLVTSTIWVVRVRRTRPTAAVVAAATVVSLPYALAGGIYARFIPVAAVLAAPVLAWAAQGMGTRVAVRWPGEWTTTAPWRVVAALLLLLFLPVALWLSAPHGQPRVAGAAATLPPGCRLFSTPLEAAGVLLLRPDVRVWVDGRSDYWGRTRLEEARAYLFRHDRPVAVPPGTTCVMAPASPTDPSTAGFVDVMDGDPAWVRRAEADGIVVWVPAAMA